MTHAITTLNLENFRNYASLKLVVPPQPVVLMGQNGAGKTNILEALSLFAPGRGLRNAAIRDMDNMQRDAPWVVAAEIYAGEEMHWVGTGRDAEAAMDKRILKINGEKQTRQHVLTDIVAMQWLTPQMDTLFLQGNTARRQWLDRLVYSLDASHAARVANYEHAMRERNKLLKDYERPDPAWLSVLETHMAQAGVAMAVARSEALMRLSDAMARMPKTFPKARMALQGDVEQKIAESTSALEAEQWLVEALAASRFRDQGAGRALVGPHRSYWHISHEPKNRLVEQCSTGEQKALLLAITVACALARQAWRGSPPILLLDEVIAHLDVEKRDALFDLIATTAIQAWLTGTDASDFTHFASHATLLHVHAGEVEKQ